MHTNILVVWNNGMLSMMAGPIKEDEKDAIIHREVVKMLEMIHSLDDHQAEKIYRMCMSEGGELERTIDDVEIDLQVYGDGASLRYGGGKEYRIEIMQYDCQIKNNEVRLN